MMNNVDNEMQAIKNNAASVMVVGLIFDEVLVYGENDVALVSLMHDHLGTPVLKQSLYAGFDVDHTLNVYYWSTNELFERYLNGDMRLADLCESATMVIHERKNINDGSSVVTDVTEKCAGF